jgi:hypothetical protein
MLKYRLLRINAAKSRWRSQLQNRKKFSFARYYTVRRMDLCVAAGIRNGFDIGSPAF